MAPSNIVLRDMQSAMHQAVPAAVHQWEAPAYGLGHHPSPQSAEDRRHRAINMVNNLYSSKAHQQQRTVYEAAIHYRDNEIPDHPATIEVFLCDVHVGDVAIYEPGDGIQTAKLPLNRAMRACTEKGITPDQYENELSVTIMTNSGRNIPLDQIPSLTTDIETMTETPPNSNDEFPSITNRKKKPGHLKQHIEKSQQQNQYSTGYGGQQQQGSTGYGGQQ
ncbi:hypothetical protein HIM_08239 [Hirsutella minnesotensis 3608]|uniref:Uncharacterized protein n=1 Tax=Hirsutella minnesotensis 3608 TaxID=1043627 RepID=A0A0F7ZSI8_9HYPO|nr:hypothetical protein HIM_09162 [Hirsutella minnesotensis 3608]KJZ72313.1 hypothetical protein HIM_08239 [Hirsutella minnesotensis 3608]